VHLKNWITGEPGFQLGLRIGCENETAPFQRIVRVFSFDALGVKKYFANPPRRLKRFAKE
jgi:hypothetical protein